ncbi:ABC transporter substrate-binding protein [Geitlerinema splendidum]|nr:ABC transporter substrate-binding protein [Geitlerinema splendidum]
MAVSLLCLFPSFLCAMKRRTLLAQTGLGATALTAAATVKVAAQVPVSSPSQPAIRWRMATAFPKSLDIMFSTIESLCQQVSDMTGGKFVITPYPVGDIAPAAKVLDTVTEGTTECGCTISLYYTDRIPALGFTGGIPFGLNAQQQNAWLFYGGGLEATQKIYRTLGLINYPAGNIGGQMGGWFRREIETVDDLKGLKIRIAGLGGSLLKRLGAEVQILGPDEILPALVAEKIEAVEFLGPYDDEKLGLHKATRYYYSPSWWEPGASNELLINLNQWQTLPPEYQTILQLAATEAHHKLLARYTAANSAALERLLANGVQLKTFSPEFVQAIYKAAVAMYEELASQDPQFREVYQPWKAFRSKIHKWNRVNEMGFATFAFNAGN